MMTGWQQHVSLAPLTTLAIGGMADYFVPVYSDADVQQVIQSCKKRQLPFFVLGGGSNTLVSDTGYQGVIVHMNIKGITHTIDDEMVMVTVGAGEGFDDFVAYCVTHGWWGLENLSAIPGTVGATPVQNVGAYGVEVADHIVSVRGYDCDNDVFIELTHEQCNFGYRTSVFKSIRRQSFIITAVTFRLSVQPNPRLNYADIASLKSMNGVSQRMIRDAIIAVRAKKFPDWSVVGTAGSFFKNPIIPTDVANALQKRDEHLPVYNVDAQTKKISLGYILDKWCGLKGYRDGKVALYQEQALVVIADRGATATDVIQFAEKIIARVKAETGIVIEWEVQRLGN